MPLKGVVSCKLPVINVISDPQKPFIQYTVSLKMSQRIQMIFQALFCNEIDYYIDKSETK